MSDLASKLKELFRQFDSDQSSVITREKLTTVLKALNPSFTEAELDALFEVADKNKDGVIQYEEFVDFICFLDPHNSFKRALEQEQADEAAFVVTMEIGSQVKEYLDTLNQNNDSTTDGYAGGKGTSSAEFKKVDTVKVPDGYNGYVLPIPCTHDGAVGLMNHFIQHGLKKPLHASYVNHLLQTFQKEYAAHHPEPVVEVDLPQGDNASFTVVGDTHGQLSDVLCIFNSHGVPSKENVFLFNGDIADRGNSSVEIFLLLMAFYLAEPSSMLINRGNHENEDMNSQSSAQGGGFVDEVKHKYGLKVYKKFYEIFKILPLATIIQKQYFVVHGGISGGKNPVTIDFLKTIKHTECTMPQPTSTKRNDKVFCDMLWSDPVDLKGCKASPRGVGVQFGPDVTAQFLDANNLKTMIRSHQLPDTMRGFQTQKGDRCITIFSASNYCGDAGNHGAVLNFKVATFPEYEIAEHFAPPLEYLSNARKSIDFSFEKMGEQYEKEYREALEAHRQQKELARLAWAIVERKPDLFKEFNDLGASEYVDTGSWLAVCTKILGSHFPLQEAIKAWNLEKEGKISIKRFLYRFSVKLDMENYTSFKGQAIMDIFETILGLDMDIQEVQKTFDADGDGSVDMQELRTLLGGLDLGLTKPQLESLIRSLFDSAAQSNSAAPQAPASPKASPRSSNMGKARRASRVVAHPPDPQALESKANSGGDSNRRISVDEFLDRFVVVYKQADNLCSDNDKETGTSLCNSMAAVGRFIMTTPASKLKPGSKDKDAKASGKLRLLFEALDTSGDGLIQIDEFVDGIAKIPGFDDIIVNEKAMDREQLLQCAQHIDSTQDGSINYLEFLHAFTIEDQCHDDSLADLLAENITTMLYRNRQAIRSACRSMDRQDCGMVMQKDFHTIVEGVNAAVSKLEKQLTPLQIDLIVDAVANEKMVDYETFMESFELCDSVGG